MKSKRRKPLNKIESIFDHRKFLIEKAKELATKMEIKNKGKKLTLVDPIKRIYKYL